MNDMNDDLLQKNAASDYNKGSDTQVSCSSSTAYITSSTSPLYCYTDPITAIDTDYINNRISTVLQYNREAFNEDDLINLLLLLDEELLLVLIAALETAASGHQISCLNHVVSRLIRQRHFSEEFLLNCLKFIENKNDFLVVHRYEITTGKYEILKFHLSADESVRDIF